jgi:UDP-N-acetylglucosamine 2-epimerase (non-hydrolysing)
MISERPEGVTAGFSRLVGVNKLNIINNILDILDNFTGFDNKKNPYGVGDASNKIVNYLSEKNIKI